MVLGGLLSISPPPAIGSPSSFPHQVPTQLAPPATAQPTVPQPTHQTATAPSPPPRPTPPRAPATCQVPLPPVCVPRPAAAEGVGGATNPPPLRGAPPPPHPQAPVAHHGLRAPSGGGSDHGRPRAFRGQWCLLWAHFAPSGPKQPQVAKSQSKACQKCPKAATGSEKRPKVRRSGQKRSDAAKGGQNSAKTAIKQSK